MKERNKEDHAVTVLREYILSGQIMPGVWIKQAELMKRLDIREMPLRFASRVLVAEMLIELHPHRGIYVRDLKVANIRAKEEMLRDDLTMILDAVMHRGYCVPKVSLPVIPAEMSVAEAYGHLFTSIAALSGNHLREASISNISDRLSIVRHIEEMLGQSPRNDFDALYAALCACEWKVLRRGLRAYFHKRIQLIPAVVVQMHELRNKDIA